MIDIRLDNVTKLYKNKNNSYIAALYKLNLEIPSGSLTILFGASGGGKTTLLKTIAGMHALDEGNIYFGDVDVTTLPPQKREIGYVSQNFALYPNMTIFENIAYPLIQEKASVDEIKERVLEIARMFDIEFLLSRKPKHLSGGQQQIVAIARAIIKHPNILILDEPFSNLDPIKRAHLISFIQKIHHMFSLTTIISTHQIQDVYSLGNRFIQIENGTIVQILTKDEIINETINT